MARAIDIKGFDEVITNLNNEIVAIKERTMGGLLKAAAFVREDMDKTPPLIPIGETGDLRASWFVSPLINGKIWGILMGFSANYAAAVHEMIGPTKTGKEIRWSRPDSGPKFFEASFKRNKNEILNIIKEEAHIK